MKTSEVANRLVELCRKGDNMQALKELYGKNVVSKEMPGTPNEITKGFEAVQKKSQDWYASVEEFHGGEISEPVLAKDHFSVAMKMDCTFKNQGRTQIEEVCVYKVDEGKIVEEQFFYNTSQN